MFSCCDCYTAEELLEGVRIYQEENDWADSLTLSWEYEPISLSVIQAIEEAGYFCEAHFGANHQIVYYKCYFVPVPEKQRVCNQQRIKEQEEQRKKERRWDILETSLTIFALLFFLLWGTFCVVSSIH
ncbi:hypothetical protein IGJ28_000228 [Enterococcus sp. AZ091]|uniref:hypothetical protein n=1 Tax=Enterococcus TaxID=1350 RepID=UPI0020907B81|nr:hypothetical protein [Enterococcus gallinarum]MBE6170514.1 hypothetical protein [Enterococcus casseliflavus]MCO5478624.1 hypothetical protein [Enterococcus gallinarum]